MECKVYMWRITEKFEEIGIYPEWNVKKPFTLKRTFCISIGIYPEWNVKEVPLHLLYFRASYWNISRMECKDEITLSNRDDDKIGIYPEWNVKIHPTTENRLSTFYWNISRMECKVLYCRNKRNVNFYWNISRMECKDYFRYHSYITDVLEYIQNGM